MSDLSNKMRDTLGHIARHAARGRSPFVTVHQPRKVVDLGVDDPSDQLAARTLFALWQRGLVRFNVTVQLTVDGREAVERELRIAPGDRSNIHPIEPDD